MATSLPTKPTANQSWGSWGDAADAAIRELQARQILTPAASGLTGGGTLAADLTLALATSGATAGTYTNATVQVDSFGRVISASNGTATVAASQLTQTIMNTTGASLTKGQVVFYNSSTTIGTTPTVSLSLASAKGTAFAAGLVTATIANNATGTILTEGLMTGLNTLALTQGAAVFVSPTTAGGLTSTAPPAPAYTFRIGFCSQSDSINGAIVVQLGIQRLGLGTTSQLLGMSATDATTEEYKTLSNSDGNLTIANAAGSIVINLAVGAVAKYVTTSSTSNTISTGSKTFTVGSGLSYTAGQTVIITNTATPANYLVGTVTSYSGSTLVVTVTVAAGSGTFTAWTVNLSGQLAPSTPATANSSVIVPYAATITPNALAGNVQHVTLTGNVTIAAPTNPQNDQLMILDLLASGGPWTVTLASGTGGFVWGTTIPASQLGSVASGTHTRIVAIFNSTANSWTVLGLQQGSAG